MFASSRIVAVSCFGLTLLLGSIDAGFAAQTIVGKWHRVDASCRNAQATLSIKPMGVDASDWGCEFNDVRRVGDTVTWRGECSFPEEVASATVKASLVGQTLYFRIDDGETLKLERCR